MPPGNTTRNRFVHQASMVATTLTWILSVYIIVTSILTIHSFYCPLPYGDMWWFVRDMSEFRSHRIGLSFLWNQQSEHRLVLPRLIFWVDLQFFPLSRRIYNCMQLLVAGRGSNAAVLRVLASRKERSRFQPLICSFGVRYDVFRVADRKSHIPLPNPVSTCLLYGVSLDSPHPAALRDRGGDWISMSLGLVAAACATLSLGCALLVWPCTNANLHYRASTPQGALDDRRRGALYLDKLLYRIPITAPER